MSALREKVEAIFLSFMVLICMLILLVIAYAVIRPVLFDSRAISNVAKGATQAINAHAKDIDDLKKKYESVELLEKTVNLLEKRIDVADKKKGE